MGTRRPPNLRCANEQTSKNERSCQTTLYITPIKSNSITMSHTSESESSAPPAKVETGYFPELKIVQTYPDVAPLCEPNEIFVDGFPRSQTRSVLKLLVPLLQNDRFKQEALLKFSVEFDSFSMSRCGTVKRAAFLNQLVKFDNFDLSLPEPCRFAAGLPHSQHHSLIFLISLMKSLVACLLDSAIPIELKIKNLSYVLSKIAKHFLTLTPQGNASKDNILVLISYNYYSKFFHDFVRGWLRDNVSQKSNENNNYEKIRLLGGYATLSKIAENGLVDLGLGPLNNYGSRTFNSQLAAYFSQNVEQGGISDFVNGLSKIGPALSSAASAADKIDKLADTAERKLEEFSEKVDDTMKDVKSSIEETKERVRTASSVFDSFKDVFENVLSITKPLAGFVNGVKDSYAKITELARLIWNWCSENIFISLPIAYALLTYLLRTFLPARLWDIIHGLVSSIGYALYTGAALYAFTCFIEYLADLAWDRTMRATVDSMNEEFGGSSMTGQNYRPVKVEDIENEKTVRDLYRAMKNMNVSTPFSAPGSPYNRNRNTVFSDGLDPMADLQSRLNKPQDGGHDIVSVLATFYCAIGVNSSKHSDIVQMLRNIPSVEKGGQLLYNSIVKIFVWMSENVTRYIGVSNPVPSLLDTRYAAFVLRAERYIAADKSATTDTTDRGIDSLQNLIDQGTLLAEDFGRLEQTVLKQLVVSVVSSLMKLKAKALSARVTEPRNRPEPVCIALIGKPGHGKSTVANLLAQTFCRHVLRDDPESLIRFKEKPTDYISVASSEKWQEGYSANTIVNIHEEWPVAIETTAEDSTFVTFIDEVNTTSKPLPMANADQKGKIFFNHPYTIITSNSDNFKSNVLLCQQAVARRIHIVCEVSSRGIRNSDGLKEISDKNIKLDLCFVAQDGTNKVISTGAEISLRSLAHYAMFLADSREKKRGQDSETIATITKSYADTFRAHIWAEARDIFTRTYNRVPAPVEVLQTIAGYWEELSEDYDLEAAGFQRPETEDVVIGLPQDLSRLAGLPLVNPTRLTSTDLMLQSGFCQTIGIPSDSESSSESEFSENEEEVFNELQAGDEDFEPPLFDNPGNSDISPDLFMRSFNPCEFMRNMITMRTTEYNRSCIEFLGMYCELVMSSGPASVSDRLPDSLGGISSNFSWNSELRGYTDWEIGFNLGVRIFNGVANYFSFVEVGAIMSMVLYFGKYKLKGIPLPTLEAQVFENLSVTAPAPDGRSFVQYNLSMEKAVGPITRVQRMFLHTMRALGFHEIFGISTRDVASINFSTTETIVQGVSRMFTGSLSKIKAIAETICELVALVKRLVRGQTTPDEIREAIMQCFTINIVEPLQEKIEELKAYVAQLSSTTHLYIVQSVAYLKKYGFPLVSGFLALAALYKGASSITRSFLFQAVPQDSGIKNPKWGRRTRTPKFRSSKGGVAQDRSVGWMENVLPKIRGNTRIVHGKRAKRGYCTFIERRIAIMPSHFLERAAQETEQGEVFFTLTDLEGGSRVDVYEEDITVLDDRNEYGKDLVVIEIHRNDIQFFPDIKKHFGNPVDYRAKLHDGLSRVTFVNFGASRDRMHTSDVLYYHGGTIEEADAKTLAQCVVKDQPLRYDCLEYNIPTRPGECGSLVFFGDKIIAIHTSGNGTFGQGPIVDLTILQSSYEALPREEAKDVDFTAFEALAMAETKNHSYDLSVHDGVIMAPISPPTSLYTKNDFFRWNPAGPIKTTVVPVDAHPARYPKARAKYGPVETNVDKELFDLAIQYYGDYLLSFPAEKIKRVLTLKEAIMGIPGQIEPLDHQTSPGLFHTMTPGGRSSVYKVTPDGKLIYGPRIDSFVAYCQSAVESMSMGNTPGFVYKDSLKMELRKESKREDPRLVFGAPLENTILKKCYFAGFSKYIVDCNYVNDSMIGIDPHKDFDKIERDFRRVGGENRHMTGDYSQYDGHVPAEFVRALATIVNRWYGDADDSPTGNVRICLANTMVTSYHNWGSIIELWSAGQCSGSYLTALFNTMRNSVMELYSCMHTARSLGLDYKDLGRRFHFENAQKYMGDDKRLATTEVYSFHTNVTHAAVVKQAWNLTYTNAAKTTDLKPYDPPEDLSLVKRMAVNHGGVYYGALELNTILNMVCWTKGEDRVGNIRNRADNAVRELSFHSKEVWDENIKKIEMQVGKLWQNPFTSQDEARASALNGWNGY